MPECAQLMDSALLPPHETRLSNPPCPAAANLTALQLQNRIRGVADLPGRRVGTWSDCECPPEPAWWSSLQEAGRGWGAPAAMSGRRACRAELCQQPTPGAPAPSSVVAPSAPPHSLPCRHHFPDAAQHRCHRVSGREGSMRWGHGPTFGSGCARGRTVYSGPHKGACSAVQMNTQPMVPCGMPRLPIATRLPRQRPVCLLVPQTLPSTTQVPMGH